MSEAQELEGLLEGIKVETRFENVVGKAEAFLSKAEGIIKNKSKLRELRGEEIVAIAEGIGWILSPEGGRRWRDLRNKNQSVPREFKEVKRTQLRKFLDMVNRLKSQFDLDSAIMLRYRIAYAAGREEGLKVFMKVIEPALRRVRDEKDFERFARLVEAVVAYHAFYGGRD